MRSFPFKKQGRKRRRGDFLKLLRMAGTSWSLLTRSEKSFFLIRVFFRLALNGMDLLAVALMGLLGAITATGLSGQNLQFFGYTIPSPTAQNVTLLVATIAILFVLKGGLAILFTRWTAIFLAGLEVKYSAKVTRYLFSGSLQRLKKYSRSEIGFLVGTSVGATFSGVLGSMTTLAIESTLFLSIFVLFLFVDWVSALFIALYFAVLVFFLQLATARRYVKAGKNVRKSSVDSGGAILEMVDAYREIAVLGKHNFFLKRFVEAKKLGARTGVNLQILKSLPRYIAETGLIIGAFGFVVWQLSKGSLGEGLLALGIFLAGSFRMMGAILPLQSIWNDLRVKQNWVVKAQEILVQLRDKPELLDSGIFSATEITFEEEHFDIADGGLSVELSDVTFTHLDKETPTIHAVSLSIASGAYVAIVGPSGAGKTTLVDLILGLYDPDTGSVELSGVDPRILREKAPGLVSYVPQRPGLVSGTIANNVALGVAAKDIDESLVREVLRKAQLLDFVDTLPNGINSSLGPHSDALSGGQIQRLGFARALYSKPRLIILDEATSALDAATEASVAANIRDVGGETTVIVIAHRLSTVQHADEVFVVDDGRVVASGTFKEVRKNVPMIEEYVRLMSFDND